MPSVTKKKAFLISGFRQNIGPYLFLKCKCFLGLFGALEGKEIFSRLVSNKTFQSCSNWKHRHADKKLKVSQIKELFIVEKEVLMLLTRIFSSSHNTFRSLKTPRVLKVGIVKCLTVTK